ncbi:hypothetical protein [cf. Phormidesmis sp. LEGE 11477]|uniref:hypothetical protein n=1 Tax=cf. Phormidesmis sp. LEGE 11477 TaxID=1828680 RepID=UPI0018806F9A|nr:hypothetical protein [cf. Phormidesmis sp. LEGE 11477]MBE9061130.1 hypothetical protein [cf. Phormidesmis sp. LEGE 11477]
MRRIHSAFSNIFGTSLAVGAIASILLVSSAPFQAGHSPLQPAAPAEATASKSLPIAHLIGIAQFVKNPTDYRLAYGDQLAQVIGASLEGDRMTISYKYLDANLDANAVKIGELVGKLDSEGIFKGVFQVQHKSDGVKANAAFAFHADGTAKAIDSETAARILL